MSDAKMNQCCKCRWVGTDDEKGDRKDFDKDLEIEITTLVCPVCDHEYFYNATERQYRNYLKRLKDANYTKP